jgi:cation transport ATPase
MIAPNSLTLARSIGFFLLYAFMFWRLFRNNRGNRVIQCGSLTLMLFLVMLALMRIPNIPIDYVAWLGFALFLLCMLTMFFLLQQGYRALRERLKERSAPTSRE